MANTRKNRRNTRKNMRKNRRTNRRANTMRRMRGGEYSMPAPVNDTSMNGPQNMSLQQGQDYGRYHVNQHGGASLVGGPYPGVVTDESLLPAELAASARVSSLNSALNEIRGMSDQAGGFIPIRSFGKRKNRKNTMRKNRKNSRKNRKASRKDRKNRKNRRNTMRRRRNNMMGGMMLNPSPLSAPSMLLSSAQEAKALSGMNAEWKLAENPRSFAPGV